jgi:hypothetical protein
MFVKEINILAYESKMSVTVTIYRADEKQRPWIKAVLMLLSVPSVILFSETAYEESSMAGSLIWPGVVEVSGQLTSWSGSTLWLQGAVENYPNWPKFRTLNFIPDNCLDLQWSKSLTIHLKNNPTDARSNANLSAWMSLFQSALVDAPEYQFLLIGDDRLACEGFPGNVRRAGNTLCEYLSVLDRSAAFMGMASGFCIYPLLENKPCRVWKHATHHAEHMERELGGSGRFAFAGDQQKFFRSGDTASSLRDQFKSLRAEMQAGT